MVFIMTFQMNISMAYSIENVKGVEKTVLSSTDLEYFKKSDDDLGEDEKSYKIKEELSSKGNLVTQYINQEDNKLKTIVWVKGINPPKMGGHDSDFSREPTYINGKLEYVEYIAPYTAGQGWYDVNKTEDRVIDKNLCFAATASNMLHWWLAQNSEYIDKYLVKNQNYTKAEELEKLRESFKSQSDSGIYKKFLKYYAYSEKGSYPDILMDLIINGYTPKETDGTNTSEADKEKLLANGPDPRGGFFYDVFGPTLLTQRRNYYSDYDGLSNDIKENILNGNLIAIDYMYGSRLKHVVTIWGAEFDLDGKISAIYLSDSDDEERYGMVRYMVKNSGGNPVLSTRLDGKGSRIDYLEILSLGKELWDENVNEKPEDNYTVDINNDGKINILDLAIVAEKYNLKSEDVGYIKDCDINNDGIIDIYDIVMVANKIEG